MEITLSKVAFSSVLRVFQYSIAELSCSFEGENFLFLTYSIVLSSTAINPALAPASIVMLQTVIRPSIDKSWIASPEYSIA